MTTPEDNGAARPDEPAAGGTAAIRPSPVPTVVGVMAIPEAKLVAIVVNTPVGQNLYFVSAQAGRIIGENLIVKAGEADSGIVVPPSGLITPN